jgi:hypothetical protein
MNRYYRSSSPRYTSQFVEEQYPTDLIMQAGAMKYQQKQQFAADIGQLSGLNATLPISSRTAEMRQNVINKWDNRINETISKIGNNYDSPQAMMELTKLKTDWVRDGDVQLIRTDAELGEKELEEQRRSSTFAQDWNPNVNPENNMLWQFREGDTYKRYQPLVKFADIGEKAIKEYESIDLSSEHVEGSIPYTDEWGNTGMKRTQGEIQYRDPKKLREKTFSLAESIINRSTPEGTYAYVKLKERLGKEPTMKDAMQILLPYESAATSRNENLNTIWDQNTGTGNSSGGIGDLTGNGPDYPLPVGNDNKYTNNISEYRTQMMASSWFGSDSTPETYSFASKNQLNRIAKTKPGTLNLSVRDKWNTLIDDTKTQRNNMSNFKYTTFDKKKQNDVTQGLVGVPISDSGILTQDASSSFLLGSVMFDLDKGSYVQDKEKESMLKKDNYVGIIGQVSKEDIANSEIGDAWIVQVGSGKDTKRYAVKKDDKTWRETQLQYNMSGDSRSKNTGVGNPVILQIDTRSDGTPVTNMVDVMSTGINGDPMNLIGNNDNELVFVPITDYTGGKERRVINVFAVNPYLAKDKDNSKDYGSPDENNEYFLGQYEQFSKSKHGNMSLNSNNDIFDEIVKDYPVLHEKKKQLIDKLRLE